MPDKNSAFSRNGSAIGHDDVKQTKTYRELANEHLARQKGLRLQIRTEKENVCSNGDLKSKGNKFTKFMKSIHNSNNINVRRNYGSNDSATNAAPKKSLKFEGSKSREKGVALRKNSSKLAFPP
jgi:hypothetical protein